MEVHLKRLYYSLTSTISEVTVDGKFFCHCLEDRVRAATATKVYGKTAIPAGRYPVIWNMSTRFRVKMPLLVGVPGYEGVRIHAGNSDVNTLGCLLLGSYDPKTPDWVSDSRAAIARFYPLVQAAYEKNQKIFVTIEDTQAHPGSPSGPETPNC